MKAIIPVSKSQKKQLERSAREHVKEAMNEYRTLIAYRVVGMMCIALAHYPGDAWGRKRLARLILGTGGAAEMLEKFSEIADWKLCRELRCIGMPEIADAIETESAKFESEEDHQ